MDQLTIELEWLTRGIRAIRIARFGDGKAGDMALELKGLKGKAMSARAHIGKLDAAYDAFNTKAGTHVSDVEGLTEQLGEMSDDLGFVTTTLGNSVAASNSGGTEKGKEKPEGEKIAIAAGEVGKVADALPQGQGAQSPLLKEGTWLPDPPKGVGFDRMG